MIKKKGNWAGCVFKIIFSDKNLEGSYLIWSLVLSQGWELFQNISYLRNCILE